MNEFTLAKPNDNDVVLNGGKGSQHLNHRGNINCRNLVHKNLFNFKNKSSDEKNTIHHNIHDSIVNSGGRFIEIVTTDHCQIIPKSFNEVKGRIQMCFRNTGKIHRKIYNGEASLPQLPHADLSTILSVLFKNLPPEQLESVLADPLIVNNIDQRLNCLAEQLHPLLQLSPATNSSPSQPGIPENHDLHLSDKTVESDKTLELNEKIEAIHRAHQECPSDIPNTQTLLQSSKPTLPSTNKKQSRNFFFDSGIIDSSSWPELLSRQIKGDRVKQILSICAFDALGINKIVTIKSFDNEKKPHNNSTSRAFKCLSCPEDWR